MVEQARREKENSFPDLVCSGRCKLVVLAIEREAVQEATFPREGFGSSVIHARPSGLDVGANVDAIARSGDLASHVTWCHRR